MHEILEVLTTTSIWLLFITFGPGYLIIVLALTYFLKKSFVNNFDPLRIQIILFIGFYLTGYLVLPFFTGIVTLSFVIISLFILIWLIVIKIIGRPRKVNLRDVMRPEFQFLILTVATVCMLAHIIVNMIIPGKIPLFTEGGVHSRFEATESSRALTWLLFSSNNIGGLMYAVTENNKIRRYSLFVIFLQIVSWILFASKGALISILFILLFSIFIAQARGDGSRSKFIKRLLVGSFVVILLLMPVYLNIIGLKGEDVDHSILIQLTNRMFSGFDQLIPAASLDLASQAEPNSLLGPNIIEYQFMPFMKAVFGKEFPYFSVGQYVLQARTGSLIETAYTFPNSNLILEAIFTSGFILGLYIFFIEILFFYILRYVALKMPISPIGFFLIGAFVSTPMGLFLSGQDWCTTNALFSMNVFICWVMSELFVEFRKFLKKNKLLRYPVKTIKTY